MFRRNKISLKLFRNAPEFTDVELLQMDTMLKSKAYKLAKMICHGWLIERLLNKNISDDYRAGYIQAFNDLERCRKEKEVKQEDSEDFTSMQAIE